MSLVNRMLRDLDDRRASEAERSGLGAQVRALPPERRLPWPRVLPGILGVAIGAAGLWFWLESQPPRHASPPQSETRIAGLPPLVVPMPADEPVPAASAVAPAAVDSLRLDLRLQSPPSPAREPHVRSEAAAVPGPAALPVDAPSIEKRPPASAPRGGAADDEYQKAIAAFRQGRSNEALSGFEAALRANPGHRQARQALLSMLMDQRRWGDARSVASDGLSLDPTQSGWAMILARLQFEQGAIADAERTMAAHALHGARSSDYLAFHGLLLEKLDRHDEARAAFARARELGPLRPELAAAIEQRLR